MQTETTELVAPDFLALTVGIVVFFAARADHPARGMPADLPLVSAFFVDIVNVGAISLFLQLYPVAL